jgi:hypothetical protein
LKRIHAPKYGEVTESEMFNWSQSALRNPSGGEADAVEIESELEDKFAHCDRPAADRRASDFFSMRVSATVSSGLAISDDINGPSKMCVKIRNRFWGWISTVADHTFSSNHNRQE